MIPNEPTIDVAHEPRIMPHLCREPQSLILSPVPKDSQRSCSAVFTMSNSCFPIPVLLKVNNNRLEMLDSEHTIANVRRHDWHVRHR